MSFHSKLQDIQIDFLQKLTSQNPKHNQKTNQEYTDFQLDSEEFVRFQKQTAAFHPYLVENQKQIAVNAMLLYGNANEILTVCLHLEKIHRIFGLRSEVLKRGLRILMTKTRKHFPTEQFDKVHLLIKGNQVSKSHQLKDLRIICLLIQRQAFLHQKISRKLILAGISLFQVISTGKHGTQQDLAVGRKYRQIDSKLLAKFYEQTANKNHGKWIRIIELIQEAGIAFNRSCAYQNIRRQVLYLFWYGYCQLKTASLPYTKILETVEFPKKRSNSWWWLLTKIERSKFFSSADRSEIVHLSNCTVVNLPQKRIIELAQIFYQSYEEWKEDIKDNSQLGISKQISGSDSKPKIKEKRQYHRKENRGKKVKESTKTNVKIEQENELQEQNHVQKPEFEIPMNLVETPENKPSNPQEKSDEIFNSDSPESKPKNKPIQEERSIPVIELSDNEQSSSLFKLSNNSDKSGHNLLAAYHKMNQNDARQPDKEEIPFPENSDNNFSKMFKLSKGQ